MDIIKYPMKSRHDITNITVELKKCLQHEIKKFVEFNQITTYD